MGQPTTNIDLKKRKVSIRGGAGKGEKEPGALWMWALAGRTEGETMPLLLKGEAPEDAAGEARASPQAPAGGTTDVETEQQQTAVCHVKSELTSEVMAAHLP